ncbi:MAG: methylenetetrahydrofolate reductase C-terminal domain-containing protein [Chloroflexi bacterium]|nr:methylenetetrahydrofolate reductase C-terminal domain-containing protein [Chloroflexota bacterium]
MKTVTAQKPAEEVMRYLEKFRSVYVIGCGTCATLCRTGGKAEVLAMKQKLEDGGRKVTGWMVIPTACDELTGEALRGAAAEIATADGVLAMTCAMGVQNIAFYLGKTRAVYPALDTLFLGMEESPGHFTEVCLQCGSCLLGRTAAICPLVRCAKSLLNGPCGGSTGGRCEISRDIPCAWQLIYDRLQETGRLEELDEIVLVKNWSTSLSGGPRRADIDSERGVVSGKTEEKK